jgi:hypothetical protein
MTGESARHVDELLVRKRHLASHSSSTPQFATRLGELRSWQAARLARTYRDLRAQPRYVAALDFFLSDLYGPANLTRRDQDLMRAWRYLRRALPASALEGLGRAIELEVLTAELDHSMVAELAPGEIDEARYAKAYRAVGARESRQHQIDLVIGAGEQLERTVRRPMLGTVLRAAHGPAHAAGFGVLQDFLERGYEAFRCLDDARELLDAIRERETTLMNALFAGNAAPLAFLDRLGGHAGA